MFRLDRQPTLDEMALMLPGRALGAVRASLGIASSPRDIERLIEAIATFADDPTSSVGRPGQVRAVA